MGTDLQKLTITGSLIKTARLTDEWYCDAENPANLIEQLKKDRAREQLKADLFTFWQRFPEVNPKYHYFMEWESVAALPVKDYRSWWEQQIDSKVRNMVRKAAKKGVKVRVVEYTDEFVEGMAKIVNESPIRQGKPFWHFGKDFETVK